jgi:hypothetical protein
MPQGNFASYAQRLGGGPPAPPMGGPPPGLGGPPNMPPPNMGPPPGMSMGGPPGDIPLGPPTPAPASTPPSTGGIPGLDAQTIAQLAPGLKLVRSMIDMMLVAAEPTPAAAPAPSPPAPPKPQVPPPPSDEELAALLGPPPEPRLGPKDLGMMPTGPKERPAPPPGMRMPTNKQNVAAAPAPRRKSLLPTPPKTPGT